VERRPRRPGGSKPGGLNQTPLANIEWLLAERGSFSISELDGVGCVAAAADNHFCYAMLVRRKKETILELLTRLDGAIPVAA
jgi:hypothetical protein